MIQSVKILLSVSLMYSLAGQTATINYTGQQILPSGEVANVTVEITLPRLPVAGVYTHTEYPVYDEGEVAHYVCSNTVTFEGASCSVSLQKNGRRVHRQVSAASWYASHQTQHSKQGGCAPVNLSGVNEAELFCHGIRLFDMERFQNRMQRIAIPAAMSFAGTGNVVRLPSGNYQLSRMNLEFPNSVIGKVFYQERSDLDLFSLWGEFELNSNRR